MTLTALGIILLGIVIKMITSPPSALVGWIVSKFALHPKLNFDEVTVTFNGNDLKEEEKRKFIDFFNSAQFMERYDVFPGNEESFLHPETDVIPFVIKKKNKKRYVNFFVYNDDDHLLVVKQWKKKIACYSMSSDDLREFSVISK